MKRELFIEKKYMLDALSEAKKAYRQDEVPVGAVVVCDGEIIARAHNLVEANTDPSAHAELLALRAASDKLGTKWLENCVLYVTLEPCAICMGAIINYRTGALAFGAYDREAGCCISKAELPRLMNGALPYVGGIMEEECKSLLSEFFAAKRRG